MILGPDSRLYSRELTAEGFNWLSVPAPSAPLSVTAKTRYSPEGVPPAAAEVLPDGRVRVVFQEPQRAITPGQAVVLYDGAPGPGRRHHLLTAKKDAALRGVLYALTLAGGPAVLKDQVVHVSAADALIHVLLHGIFPPLQIVSQPVYARRSAKLHGFGQHAENFLHGGQNIFRRFFSAMLDTAPRLWYSNCCRQLPVWWNW